MKKCIMLIFVVCYLISTAGCDADEYYMNMEVSETAEAEVSSSGVATNMLHWEPYYTGDDEVQWEHDGEPWDRDINGSYHAEDQSQGMKAFRFLTGKGGEEPDYEDYAGSYINDSGSLTILVINPTLERAEYYGELCKTGVWIIKAEHSRTELQKAREEAVKAIKKWIEEHPDKTVNIRGSGPEYEKNLVYVDIAGYDCAEMEAELNLHEYVKLNYSPVQPDARIDETIPRAPVSSVEVINGVTFYMEQEVYPVNPTYITVKLDNKTNTVYDYDIHQYGLEKYISGRWQKLDFPYSTAEPGHCVAEYRQVINTFSPAVLYGHLGAGLYRIPVYAFKDDYYKRSEGYAEFELSPEVEKLPYTLEEKKNIDEKARPDWIWNTDGELRD